MSTVTTLIQAAQQIHAGLYLAPSPAPAPTGTIDTSTVVHNLVDNIGWLAAAALAAMVGLTIMGRSRRGNMGEAATTGGIYVFGLIFLVGAFLMFAVASGLVRTLFGA